MSRSALPIVLTLLLVAVTIPHSAEDFRFGEFARFGISTSIAASTLAVVYAAQLLGIVLAWRGSNGGLWLLALTGLLWCIGAIAVHGDELLAGGTYRNGIESKALIVAIIVFGAAVFVAAVARARR